jgi:hypothetical protein
MARFNFALGSLLNLFNRNKAVEMTRRNFRTQTEQPGTVTRSWPVATAFHF